MNTNASFRSIREEVSREEWQTRVDLAACYRLALLRRLDRIDPGFRS